MAQDPTVRPAARVPAEREATDYRLLAEASVDVIWSCDLQMRFTYVSPSVERLLGITPDECVVIAPHGTVAPESLERLGRVLAEELEREAREPGTAGMRTVEVEQLHRDGRRVATEVITSFLRDPAGRPVAICGVTRDVTERKSAERRLREAEDRYRSELQEAMASLERRVRERTAELEAANARLREEMEERREAEAALIRVERLSAVGTLAAGVAHEFNNVHQIVAGWARVAARDPGLGEAGRDAIEHVLAASQRGSGVAENLLTFSSVRRGRCRRSPRARSTWCGGSSSPRASRCASSSRRCPTPSWTPGSCRRCCSTCSSTPSTRCSGARCAG
jgi:PAS domain S-box-containing protein